MEPRRSGPERTVWTGEGAERVDEFHENRQALAFLEELERSKDTPQSIQCIDFSCSFLFFSLTRSRGHRERRLHAAGGRVHRQPAPAAARAAPAREQSGPQPDHLPHQPAPLRVAQRLQGLHLPRPPRSRPQQYSLSLFLISSMQITRSAMRASASFSCFSNTTASPISARSSCSVFIPPHFDSRLPLRHGHRLHAALHPPPREQSH